MAVRSRKKKSLPAAKAVLDKAQALEEPALANPFSRSYERRQALKKSGMGDREAMLDGAYVRLVALDSIAFPVIVELTEIAHKTAAANGFWDKETGVTVTQKLMLIVDEVCEAMQEIRKDYGDPCIAIDKKDEHYFALPEALLDELADVIIRVMDLAGRSSGGEHYLAATLTQKLIKNTERPYRHGKKF